MDATSGVKVRKLSVKLHRGLPSIRFLMDNLFREDPEEYVPTKFCGRILRCGSMIDGSSLVQSFLSVHTKGDIVSILSLFQLNFIVK